jgi:hypothetical protein
MPAPRVAAKPPADTRSRPPRGRLRPLAEPRPAEASTTSPGATDPQSYLLWAGFMAGAPSGDFEFGAYFVDQETSGTIRYTWTPAPKQP